MQTSIPATLYRGGTSKGPLFLAHQLPASVEKLSEVLLAAMGSPHPRQIDGVGGAESLTSKVVIVSRSKRPGVDIDYLFVQVTPNSSVVDYSSNCGNMLSAVAPFAVEHGLVAAGLGQTQVSIYNINTDSLISLVIETPAGQVTYDGNAAIDGVAGTAAPVRQNFAGSVGSKTGKLLPTRNVREEILGVEVTCIDVAVPAVLIDATAVGKTGRESKQELDADWALIERLNAIRIEAGKRMGLGDCSELVLPKPLLLAAAANGGTIASRDFVPYECHAAHSVTGAIALATACAVQGTVASKVSGVLMRGTVRIEHPGGAMDIEINASGSGDAFRLNEAVLLRTCRKLFEGAICIPSSVWDGSDRAESAATLAAGLSWVRCSPT
ncbi:MAG: 4-oxalomesaconate tautomerase [Ramlibacter sp.]|jgi:4-oxalomesaconate tautomerase|nr:4-oxalomesaconate tautomerase [Ramlibacter sp.]